MKSDKRPTGGFGGSFWRLIGSVLVVFSCRCFGRCYPLDFRLNDNTLPILLKQVFIRTFAIEVCGYSSGMKAVTHVVRKWLRLVMGHCSLT